MGTVWGDIFGIMIPCYTLRHEKAMIHSTRIEQAIRAAAVLHEGQIRRGQRVPYVSHLFAVALIMYRYTDDEDTIVAALLHDTLEDTEYTPEELREDFGDNVLKLVRAVTEPSDEKDWHARKAAYVQQLKAAPVEALCIAAADKIHNMQCAMLDFGDAPQKFAATFGGSLEERVLQYQELSNILNNRLDNDIVSEFNHTYAKYKDFILDAQARTA